MFEAIIPLRSKSRDLKDKNILVFKNRLNLVNFTIKKLINIKEIRNIYILTDSEIYKNKILKHPKIDIAYKRKKTLSTNNSKVDNLIYDFLTSYNKKESNNKFLLFQVTSPTLRKKEILKTLNFIKKKRVSSLMHVTKNLESPYEIIEIKKKKWKYLMKKRIINRQNYKGNFKFITGSMYYFTRDFFNKSREIVNHKTYPFEIDRINFVDIDDQFTFELAKKIENLKIRN